LQLGTTLWAITNIGNRLFVNAATLVAFKFTSVFALWVV
jgi:hypothetical protein